MCKKNKAGGCNCCCKPILVRVDEFNSRWPCWVNIPASAPFTGSGPLSARFDFGTTGKMIRHDDSADSLAEFQRGIGALAVLWALPFSMEMIVEFDSIYDNGTNSTEFDFFNSNIFAGVNYRQRLRFQQKSPGGGFGTIDIALNSSSITYTSSGALKVHIRCQYDTDGMTSWVWLNDTAPTFTTVGGLRNGVKVTGTMPSGVATNSSWGFYQTALRSFPSDVYQVNRMEVRKWNHVTDGLLPEP